MQISKVNFLTFPGLFQDKIKIFHDYFLWAWDTVTSLVDKVEYFE